MAALAVATTSGALLLPFNVQSASAAVTAYRATTQWIGGGGTTINARTAASITSQVSYTIRVGTTLSIECQTIGSKLGFSAYAENRTWDRLSDGRYVHDVVTTAPGSTRQPLPDGGYAFFTPSIPRCDAGSSTVQSPRDTYPDADAVYCGSATDKYSWCKGGRWYSSRGFGYRNCTDYVAWVKGLRQSQIAYRGSANAFEWKDGWMSRGWTVSTTPKVGAVAWWGKSVGGGYGHVAVVTAVNRDGSVQVAQYNADGRGNYSVTPSTRAEYYLY